MLCFYTAIQGITDYAKCHHWWKEYAESDDIILTGGFLSGEALVYHLDQPEQYRFLHYVTAFETFKIAAETPEVMWYVNAAPLPAEFRTVVDQAFPHQVTLEGNAGISAILVASKRDF